VRQRLHQALIDTVSLLFLGLGICGQSDSSFRFRKLVPLDHIGSKAEMTTKKIDILRVRNLLLELFPAFDRSKASYRMGRDPQPQELTIAKGVRQGEDCENGAGRSAAFNYQDALKDGAKAGSILDSRIDPARCAPKQSS
jgi:hypothetical protein